MIRINLLPHRDMFRQKQILEYIIVFMSAVLITVSLVVAVDLWSTQDLTSLQEEQESLRAQNQVLSKKIGELRNLDSLRKEVEGKLQIVDELQAGRFRTLITLETIAKIIPQNIWLTETNDNFNNITITGYGESSQAVANFMRSLQGQTLFSDIRLLFDEQSIVEDVLVRKFSLTLRRLTLIEQEALEKKAKEVKK